MKKIFLLIIILIAALKLSGQSHGITYQAVILDADAQEIPGVDITGNYLPNQALTIRFTIQDENEIIEYQEVQSTTTDKYGMINLTIGSGTTTTSSPVIFTGIDWDGMPKDLRVEISIGESGTDFTELSFQPLYFVPYAFHRNITATGTMIIDGASTLNSSLEVANGSPANLTGSLAVTGTSTFNDVLTVNSTSALNGQVTINADISGNDDQYDAYPLRVQGSNQGIGITLDGSRSSDNNFITFRDANGTQGRIEGQVDADVYNDPEFIFDQAMFAAKTAVQIVNLATAVAASVLDPGNVVIEAANSALLVAEIAEYEIFAFSNLGVAYESGSGDYAEWLPRLYPDEEIEYGQIVGVYGGKISKKTEGAEMLMVVSRSPIVLGNMPPDSIGESLCEKVGFMGQVPVRVVGKVKKGDYIVSYKSGSGFGKAVPPSELTIDQLSSVVGRSWTDASNTGVNLVNIVVGIKTNEWTGFIKSNRAEIDSLRNEVAYLKDRIKKSDDILSQFVPGYREAIESSSAVVEAGSAGKADSTGKTISSPVIPGKSVYPQVVAREAVLESFSRAAAFLEAQGVDLSKNAFYSKMHSDPEYREKVVNTIINSYNQNKTDL
ncbi:MAG: hypothetical protein MUF36_12825 [Bacteroidales bacterium]|nr:hypothetical protein [Bacteroidales bacterium]